MTAGAIDAVIKAAIAAAGVIFFALIIRLGGKGRT
jgi:hypothetical protein